MLSGVCQLTRHHKVYLKVFAQIQRYQSYIQSAAHVLHSVICSVRFLGYLAVHDLLLHA